MSSVIVIGAGIIGVSIADALAQRGVSVTVLDMRSPGRGASQASAGVLAPYIEAHEDSPLLDLGTRSLAMFDDFIAGIRLRSRLPIEYARTGTLDVALDERDVARLSASAAWLARKDVAYEWMEGPRLRQFEASVTPAALGALMIPSHGLVGVASLIKALVASARLSGAVFESPVEAAQVMPKADRVEVRAGDRHYDAGHVVIAAGSWSSRIRITGVKLPAVRPVRGQLLHLTWPPALLAPGPSTDGLPSRVVWGPRCYTVPWSDGSLLVGATVEDVGFDEGATVAGVNGLLQAVSELLPQSRRAAFSAVRVGLRPASGDELPIIGPLPAAPRVVMATGHYRNGILLAPLTARMVADAITTPSGGQ